MGRGGQDGISLVVRTKATGDEKVPKILVRFYIPPTEKKQNKPKPGCDILHCALRQRLRPLSLLTIHGVT